MTSALVIPTTGLMEIYTYEPDFGWPKLLDSKGGNGGYVRLTLGTDADEVGQVILCPSVEGKALPSNMRAIRVVYALLGAWVSFDGPVVITGLEDDTATRLMQTVGAP